VLLINEFDSVANGVAAQLFQDNYLSVSQNGAGPMDRELVCIVDFHGKGFIIIKTHPMEVPC